jgi:hypothetical protein
MPKLTNKFGLPEPIYQAIKADPYNAGGANITVTQLIKPPRPVQLMKRHEDKITEDISGRLWATYGQFMHALLERGMPAGQTEYILEKRLFSTFSNWLVSGQLDLYENATQTLFDYKFVGAYAIKLALREGRTEWEQQLNCLAELARRNNLPVKNIKIIACARDFSEKVEAEGLLPITTINFQLWSPEQAAAWIEGRVAIHQEASLIDDNKLPLCTRAERWENNKGENKNCLRYCSARTVCDFAKALPKP